MSKHGVDLLRSDTGHVMAWPTAQVPAAVQPTQTRWAAALDADGYTAAPAPSAPAARAVVTSTTMDRSTLVVTLANWMILLALFCTFLLASTASSPDSVFSGSTSGADSTTSAPATR